MEKFNDEQYAVNETDCKEADTVEEVADAEVTDAEVTETLTLEEIPAEETANVCAKCGAVLNPAHKFCAVCGHKVGEEAEAATQEAPAEQEEPVAESTLVAEAKKPGMKKGLIIGLVALIVIGVLFIGVSSAQKSSLHNRLMEENWWSYKEGTKIYLDFSDNQIDYSGDFGILGNCHIATMSYEVVNGHTILVYGKEIEVEFDEDSVTFRPSFVNSDSFSLWLE